MGASKGFTRWISSSTKRIYDAIELRSPVSVKTHDIDDQTIRHPTSNSMHHRHIKDCSLHCTTSTYTSSHPQTNTPSTFVQYNQRRRSIPELSTVLSRIESVANISVWYNVRCRAEGWIAWSTRGSFIISVGREIRFQSEDDITYKQSGQWW